MKLEPPQARELRGMMKSIEKQLSSALKMEAAGATMELKLLNGAQ